MPPSCRLPEPSDGNSEKPVAEADRCAAVIKNDAPCEAPPGRVPEFAQAPEVALTDGCGGLHLHTCDRGVPLFQHDVHLKVITIAKVKELDGRWTPACLTSQLLHDEGLEHRAHQLPIPVQSRGVDPQ